MKKNVHTGFVSIVGRANAGKSTLLNTLSKMPLAIVSRKAQTTRHNIRAVIDEDEAQIIFIDTPGIHKAETALGTFMNDSALNGILQSDFVLLLMEATKLKLGEFEELVLDYLQANKLKCFIVITKCDLVKKETILPFIAQYDAINEVEAVIPISVKKAEGLEHLLEELTKKLPLGPRLYPRDYFTDQSERTLASEYIREKILFYCHEEVPHGTAVIIDKFEEKYEETVYSNFDENSERKLARIFASILCDKISHKGMIIGKNGLNLKRIGTAARKDLEKILGCKVYLELHVKVRENWRNKSHYLNDLGYKQ